MSQHVCAGEISTIELNDGSIDSGDMNALMANPQFRRLMENAKIKEITREAVK